MGNGSMALLARVAAGAQKLQESLPSIADDWVERGLSQKDIVAQRDIISLLGLRGKHPENIAASIVRAALYGFDDIGKITGFPGLVSRDVYEGVSQEHRRRELDTYNRENPNSLRNRSAEELRQMSEMGIRASGKIPVSDAEKMFVYEYSLRPDYVTPKGISWIRIAREVNKEFDNNRTAKAARNIAYKCGKKSS